MKLPLSVSLRARLGIALILAFAFLSAVRLLLGVFPFDSRALGRDEVARSERRWEGFRRILTPGETLGYMTDREVRSWADEVLAGRRYILVQYALSPIVVLRTPDRRLVVGDFEDPASLSKILSRGEFRVLYHFGDKVLLVRETPP